jgi:type VI secretion system protein ImpG
MSFENIYNSELNRLSELGKEFASVNPSIASYLSGQSGDPDVERLMQGFAFLTSMVRQKMNDDVPEIVNNISELIGVNLIKPSPATTVLNLEMQGKNQDGFLVPQGTVFSSKRIEGVSCPFTVSWDCAIQPIVLTSAKIQPNAGGSRLTLSFDLEGISIVQWGGNSLSLYLAGSYPDACTILMALRKKLIGAYISEPNDESTKAPIELNFIGLEVDRPLNACDQNIATHLRWLREFQYFPERAFFFNIENINQWGNNSPHKTFDIVMDFSVPLADLPKINEEQFQCNVVPATNLFECYSEPIELTHLKENYLISPMGYSNVEAHVYDVISVTGRIQGESQEKIYSSNASVNAEDNNFLYQISPAESFNKGVIDYRLRVLMNEETDYLKRETLSLKILCTNGNLPNQLRVGDINLRSENSPEKIVVTNIINPISSTRMSIGEDALFKITAHARFGTRPFESKEALKGFLGLYLPDGGKDVARINAAERRIEGISSLLIEDDYRISRGNMIRGAKITIVLNYDNFSGVGDLALFGEMLANFNSAVVSLNSYVTLIIKDEVSGELLEWPYLITLNQTL